MNNLSKILWNYLLTKYLRRFTRRDQLLAWQHHKVCQFLEKTLPKSKFYRDYYQGLEIANWQQFPVIDKSIMMKNFDALNTVGIQKKAAFSLASQAEKTRSFRATLAGYTVGLSSGTSGNRGLFIVSQAEQQAWAGTILAKALPEFILIPQRIAFFLRANSNLYETVQGQRIQFEYFDLFNPLSSHIDRLNSLAITILVAPPSMLRLLADAKRSGKLNLAPKKVISVAEVLDPLDEAYIQASFAQPVHQLYQCTEGFLASTCNHGTLHLNEDLLVIQKEYLDQAAGKFMPIITDFNRFTQPIIRYRLDDILTERQTPCPCGSVLTAIDHIEGRRDDIFWLPHQTDGQLIPVFPDFIRRSILLAAEEIEEYRVVQKNPDLIEIFLKIPADQQTAIQNKVERSLRELFKQSHCQIPTFHYRDYPARTEHHQKLRRIQRDFTPDASL